VLGLCKGKRYKITEIAEFPGAQREATSFKPASAELPQFGKLSKTAKA
jgi:hypothetical protein